MAQSPQTLRRLEDKLRQQQQQLMAHTMSAVEQGRETATEDTQDAADQAVLSYQKEMLFRQGTHGAGQLTMIRGALGRIAEGTFGDCIQCGSVIGAKRLEALPWTPYCIECQEKIENGELTDPVRAA